MANFSKDQKVNFKRNSIIFADNIPIIAVDDQQKMYVIESSFGWLPDALRQAKYKLDKTKKYLFVTAEELKAVS